MRLLFTKPRQFLFLLSTLFIFFILRFPSLFEPHWYGDESIYEAIGYALRHGRILYSGIWDNKPPVLYLLYALVNGELFWIKVLSLLFGLFAVLSFYLLATKIFKRQLSSMCSTLFFALFFALPMFEGNVANAENFLLFPVIVTGYLLYAEKKYRPSRTHFLSAGIIIGVSFLLKVVAVFDLLAFLFFLSLLEDRTYPFSSSFVKKITPLLSGFFIPFVIATLYFISVGSLSAFIQSAFLSNVGYVNVENQFIIPQGYLLVKLIILLFYLFIIYTKRRSFTPAQLYIALWFGFALFSTTFSQRPYTHYLLILLPPFSLAIGQLVILKRKSQIALTLALILLTTLLLKFYWYNNPKETLGYYANFVAFIVGKKDVQSYNQVFDMRTTRDYDILAYLKGHLQPTDTLFIWGDAAELYPLTNKLPIGRYTVAYHMKINEKTLSESLATFNKVKPGYIVILPDVGYIPFYLSPYHVKAIIDGAVIYERNF